MTHLIPDVNSVSNLFRRFYCSLLSLSLLSIIYATLLIIRDTNPKCIECSYQFVLPFLSHPSMKMWMKGQFKVWSYFKHLEILGSLKSLSISIQFVSSISRSSKVSRKVCCWDSPGVRDKCFHLVNYNCILMNFRYDTHFFSMKYKKCSKWKKNNNNTSWQ